MAEAAVNTTKHSRGAQAPDIAVFIGRFQPQHAAHEAVIREGLKRVGRVLVLVGSANEPRSLRNPFTGAERAAMLRATFADEPGLIVATLEDSCYNLNEWLARVQQAVAEAWPAFRQQAREDLPAVPCVALIGHSKDSSSYYLRLFPQWTSIEVPQAHELSATALRLALFGGAQDIEWPAARQALADALNEHYTRARAGAKAFLAKQRKALADGSGEIVSTAVLDFLDYFIDGGGEAVPGYAHTAYRTLCDEQAFVNHYQAIWKAAPYPPIFVTADAVVVQSGHVLMVKRRNHPGRGLWALPGGFVNQDEPVLDAALRELAEETGIDMREKVLRKNIFANEVFDAPHRSSRGRTITHAFLIHLDPGPMPRLHRQREEVEGLRWVPLAELDRSQCFEDHYAIIRHLTARI